MPLPSALPTDAPWPCLKVQSVTRTFSKGREPRTHLKETLSSPTSIVQRRMMTLRQLAGSMPSVLGDLAGAVIVKSSQTTSSHLNRAMLKLGASLIVTPAICTRWQSRSRMRRGRCPGGTPPLPLLAPAAFIAITRSHHFAPAPSIVPPPRMAMFEAFSAPMIGLTIGRNSSVSGSPLGSSAVP
jgi:hypothetical protein